MKLRLYVVLALLVVSSFALKAHAQSTAAALPFLSPMFSDNMVLQRDQSDPVWGWTTPGQTIVVAVADTSATATTSGIADTSAKAVAGKDGKWMVRLPPLSVGGPYTMTVSGGPMTVTLTNILVGDVWVCSGQSNMQFGVRNLLNADEEIARANYPRIRLFTASMTTALSPKPTTDASWMVCTPDNLKSDGAWGGFTAVGYFFGRDLYQDLHIPIGLIHSTWGGTPAEAWTSEQALRANMKPDFDKQLDELDTARAAGTKSPIEDNSSYPSVLFNGMINPLVPFGIKGVIWYQGESNADTAYRAYRYGKLLPTMIKDWRARWGEQNFPFLIVQLAGWQNPPAEPGDDNWADLRNAQWLTARTVPNTGIATAIDIGDTADIHPKNKQEVGRRLALVAAKMVYHQRVEDYGPVFSSMIVNGNAVTMHFTHLGGGLTTTDGDHPKGFAVCGADHKWYWANATIVGDTIVASAWQVSSPVAVRYAWAMGQIGNVAGKDRLPMFPFRTDDFPLAADLIQQGK